MSRRKELKSYIPYSAPWWDEKGEACVEPSFGVSRSFIKDEIVIPLHFDEIRSKYTEHCNTFFPTEDTPYFSEISFLSQDDLIFILNSFGKKTFIRQVYFSGGGPGQNYPCHINNSRFETTAFKRWLLKKVGYTHDGVNVIKKIK